MNKGMGNLKCGISIEMLSAYIDNELSAQERDGIERHLRTCITCQKIVDEFKEIDEQIRGIEVKEPSSEFISSLKKRVMEKIELNNRFTFWRFVPIFLPVASAAILLLVITRTEGMTNHVSMKNRIALVFLPEESQRSQEEIEVVIPEPQKVIKTRSLPPVTLVEKEAVRTKLEEPEPYEKIASPRPASDKKEGEENKQAVIRAIIDSTGRIVNVARGKSIIPERDTTILQMLKGKQISPPKVQGRPTQMFVEFVPEEKDSN